jgi:hypothetical protein
MAKKEKKRKFWNPQSFLLEPKYCTHQAINENNFQESQKKFFSNRTLI